MNRYAFLSFLVVFVFLGCSRNKNTFTSRTYHRMTSRFNPFFNGEQALIKGQDVLEKSTQDNFDEILQVYPWGNEEIAKTIASDMDRTIEKGSKVIQRHSMYIRGKQHNPYVVESYMIIGQARFYKYDLFPALETFNYIINQFPKTTEFYEAQLWAGRVNIRIGNYYAAENNFNLLYKNDKVPKKLSPHIRASMAEMYIQTKQYNAAYKSLEDAVEDAPSKSLKARWYFIMGQLQELQGEKHLASESFGKCADNHPLNYEMEFTARLRQARNFDVFMQDPNEIYGVLKSLAKDAKNKEYLDQIFYAMAEVAVEEEDFPKAQKYLEKSIEKSTNNPAQKGKSYLKLGNIEYDFESYVAATYYYDSALVVLPENYKDLKQVEKRKVSLDKLVKNIQTIALNDSLLMLSELSEKEQTEIFEDYIEWLEEEQERKEREAELMALNKQLNQAGSQAPTAGAGSGGFYFYNKAIREKGISDFQNLWGNIELGDNWRVKSLRSSGGGINTSINQESENVAKSGKSIADEYTVDYYLNRIPKDLAAKAICLNQIKDAFLSNGIIYKEELDNIKLSVKTYEEFIKRFGNAPEVPQTHYALFRIYKSEGSDREAVKHRDTLLSKYPDTYYAELLRDPGALQKDNSREKKAEDAYTAAYQQMENGAFADARLSADAGEKQYQDTKYPSKFAILKAFCYGKEGNENDYVASLQYVKKVYPNTPEGNVALGLLNHLDGPEAKASPYSFNPNIDHNFVMVLPSKGVNANTLRNELALLNQKEYKFRNFQVKNTFLDPQTQVILVRGFKNVAEAKEYLSKVEKNTQIIKALEGNNPQMFLVDTKNYKLLYERRDLKEYISFYARYY